MKTEGHHTGRYLFQQYNADKIENRKSKNIILININAIPVILKTSEDW